MTAVKGSWLAMALLVAGLSVVPACGVQAMQAGAVQGHLLRVDRGEGDGDGWGWFPLWFGVHLFAPRPPVIVERQYYSPPPPPPPPADNYYYFCRNPEGYYPQVPSCPGGWLRVLPEGGPPR